MRKIYIPPPRPLPRPCVRVRPLPPRPKKPVTIRIGNVTRTYWI